MKKIFPTSLFVRILSAAFAFVAILLISGISNAQLPASGTAVTANGTYTVQAGISSITIDCWGGGGGGGAVTGISTNASAGGGGGGGTFSTVTISVSPGQTYTVTVGAGGNAGTSNGSGGVGGTTTVTGTAGTCSAIGGAGGAGNSSGSNGSGGNGGLASACTPAAGAFSGGNGAHGYFNETGGGPGGGGAGSAAAGNAATLPAYPTCPAAGAGGTGNPNSAPFKGGNGGTSPCGSNGKGGNGTAPGGGGGGAVEVSSSANGGNGAAGQVVFTYCIVPTGGTISGNQSVCANVNGVTYSITGVSNALTYTWTLPSGGTIASGAGTANITVNWGSTGGTYTLSCAPQNTTSCIEAAINYSVLVTAIPTQPSVITVPNPICQGSSQTYSVTNDLNVNTYNWTAPSGWTGTSTTNSINLIATATGGTLSVTGTNTCGTSPSQSASVAPNLPVPLTPSPIVHQ